MNGLMLTRQNGSVGDVIDCLNGTNRPRLPDNVIKKEAKLAEWLELAEREDNPALDDLRKFKEVPYTEVIALSAFLNGFTPFDTKHGVKGAEFENVLVVLGRGWNLYNFNQFLEWENNGVPADKQESYERNRNLFYVACSRPKKRLCLLFTQQLSASALQALENWFGQENILAV